MKIKERIFGIITLGMISCLAAVPASAQTRHGSYILSVSVFAPLVALIAGILILIFPRVLNYIVAIYLILVGIIGLFGLR